MTIHSRAPRQPMGFDVRNGHSQMLIDANEGAPHNDYIAEEPSHSVTAHTVMLLMLAG